MIAELITESRLHRSDIYDKRRWSVCPDSKVNCISVDEEVTQDENKRVPRAGK